MIDGTADQLEQPEQPSVTPLAGTTASGLPYPSDTDAVMLGAQAIKGLADAIDRRFRTVAVTIDPPSTAAHTSMTAQTVAIAGLAVGDLCFWIGQSVAGPLHYWTAPVCAVAGQITLRGYNADSAVNDPPSATHYFMVVAHA